MGRKLVCGLLSVVVLLGMRLPCAAAEDGGSIRVTLTREEDRTYYGTVELYRVGTEVDGGYRLGSGFGGGFVGPEDAQAPALAQWLTDRVGTADGYQVLDSYGCAEFTGLDAGLYLLVQEDPAEGFYPFLPFLVRLPWEGQWDILTFPKLESIPVAIPETGDEFLLWPFVGAMGLSSAGLLIMSGKKRK